MLLHIKFTIGNLIISFEKFRRLRYEADIAVFVVSLFKFNGIDALSIVTKLYVI